jgi:hypothetical protein
LVVIAFAGWAYDAGRRVAGFDRGETADMLEQLRSQNVVLESELARLRSLLTASESSLQIEQAAQKILSEKHGVLVQENNKLREELAVFERLTKFEGKRNEEVDLDQVSVTPDAAKGYFRYSFLVALQGARRGKETRFNLRINVVPRGDQTGAKIAVPGNEGAESGRYEIVLRNFRRIEGRFRLPEGVQPAAVEIEILEAGQPKASKRVVL